MAELTAEALLRSMVAASDDPELSDDEIATLLAASAVADSNGFAPTSDSWTPTYNLNIGARSGWKLKMAKTAGRYDFGSDIHRVSRSQFFAHCQEMVRQYSKGVNTYVQMESTSMSNSFDPVIGNLNA